jgi:phospholipid/cholesterol/gamma-HCH transport system substrate-binding protein
MRRARRRKPRLSPVAIGLIALVVVAAGTYLGFTKQLPFRSPYEVKAAFTSANNLKPGSPVRIAGVEVGRVTKVEGAKRGGEGAIVTMTVGESGRPLHADAKAKIRPRIFLEGNFFVDVEPGSPAAPELAEGDTIPVNQTATPVQLDQLLTSLQSDTREDLRTLLDQYSRALAGGGAEGFNRSIPHWEPAYRGTAIVNEAMLGRAEHDLSGYVEGAGATAAALDRNATQLKSLITDFNTTAAAFARSNGALRDAVAELPNTLRIAQPALAALNDSFPPLRAFAQELRPGVRSSGPALDASMPLVRELRGLVSEPELRGLVRDLRPTVPALARLSRASVPLSREVRRLASCQNEVIVPWSESKVEDEVFPAAGTVAEETPKSLPGLAGESRAGDANGQWFRVLAAGGTNLIETKPGMFATSALPILGANPPKPNARPPLRADVPCETQEPPDLRSKPGPPPKQHQVDTSSKAFQDRYAKARGEAVKFLEDALKREKLDGILKIADADATRDLLARIAAQKGKP